MHWLFADSVDHRVVQLVSIDDVAVFAVSRENASHETDVMKKACSNEVGVITGRRRCEQRSPFHDVVPNERYQHRMFDIVIKSIAVTDALESETGCRLETSNKACARRSKSATHMGCQE